MFVQGRSVRWIEIVVGFVLAFLLGVEVGHWLFYLLWVAK